MSETNAVTSIEEYQPVFLQRFEEANLKDALLRGIYKYGWETPSVIQQQGIPAIMTGRDVIMQSQSGMGKTGTFSVALLQQIDETVPEIQGLIILPTRELADQVHRVIQSLGDMMEVNFIKCVGGTRVDGRLTYANRATILVGTPGKISAVLSQSLIRSQPFGIRIMVVDEFDKTLEEDFIPTIREIFNHISRTAQVILSSATVNESVLEIATVL